MTDFLGLNRAIPSAPLLNRDEQAGLGFETMSWNHLNRYVEAAEHLPRVFGGSAAVAKAVDRLRPVVEKFGSARQLRMLIQSQAGTQGQTGTQGQAGVLAADRPPETLFGGAAWMVDHLRRSACSISATLQNFPSLSSSPGAVKNALRQLGGDAQRARQAIGPMVEALKDFKTAALDANGALATAYAQDAAALRQMQEDLGRFKAKAENLEQQIGQLGFFSAGKKQELEQELTALNEEKNALSVQSEALRAALGAVERVQNEGFWLEPGVDDLVGFLDRLRQVLTAFGSGMTQVAADASDAQLQDVAGMEPVLGKTEAIKQWKAIAEAAGAFLDRATGGGGTGGGATGGGAVVGEQS